MASFPESSSIVAAWDINPYFTLQGNYGLPLTIDVNVAVPSKTLVDKQGFTIASPDLNLPFTIEWAKQWSFGAELHPFAGSFYLSLAMAKRSVQVESHIDSSLLFNDGKSTVLSNTRFDIDLATLTEQDLLRSAIGQRFRSRFLFWGWSMGLMKPLRSSSDIANSVRISNAMASDPNAGTADNLEEARVAQEALVRAKVRDQLGFLESKSLPLLGVEFGLNF
jgi:hypothetical protein